MSDDQLPRQAAARDAGAATRVKICGLTREADLEAAVAAGADAVGVIADVPVDTPREVAPDSAADLLAAVPPFLTGVLVTMPETATDAVELIRSVRPDAVQIHGDAAPDDIATIAAETGVAVIKTVGADDPDRARAYDGVADALLVDSVDDDGGGGTGRTHDWERTRAATADLTAPVVLAGGLTPDNVTSAVRTVRPFAVDVASGVEREGGIKDHEAVRAFVANATAAGRDGDAGDGDPDGSPVGTGVEP